MPTPDPSIAIRPLREADYPAVRAIFEEGIGTGISTLETEAPEWAAWNAAHIAACRLVAELDGRVVGWAALCPVTPRPVYAGVVELSIYITAAARGRGIGRKLLDALVEASEREGHWTIQSNVWPENEASIRLHKACGFRIVGLRQRVGLCRGRFHDILLIERRSPVVGVDRDS